MGKVQKNFALLKRSANSQRVSLRKLQANSSSLSTEEEANEGSNKRKTDKEDKHGEYDGNKEKIVRNRMDTDWTPSLSAVFKILFSMRLSASLWSLISDCDEVYNYWEPLHLVLFGRGFQTWEYSPVYAIRSWLYILFYAAPAQLLLPFLAQSKVILFFSLRFFIGFMTLLSEMVLYRSLCHRFGNFLGRSFVLISLFSSAMFGASCAFLPSSFSMVMNMFAMASYLCEQWFLAILCTGIGTLIGWPFAAVLGFPIVLEMLVLRPRQLAYKFAFYSTMVGAALIGILFTVDSHFFGRPVLAPLNIVLYNIFSAHGPNLYGVEPITYYLRNLLLNFNIVFPMAVFAIPLVSIFYFFTHGYEKHRKDAESSGRFSSLFAGWSLNRWHNFRPALLLSLTTLIWLAIFFLQPHKEERFLFPIYPHICLLAAITLECLCRCMPSHSLSISLCTTLLGIFVLVSFSRIVALHRNYSGIMDSYKTFNDKLLTGQIHLTEIKTNNSSGSVRFCIGKEWHRFPSSFFLPEQIVTTDNKQQKQKYRVELEFVRSEFRGLLPGHFAEGTIPNVTQLTPQGMNDQNQEELTRYVPLDTCHFLLDLTGTSLTDLEPDYTKMSFFKSVVQQPVLLPEQSHPLFRAFYIPFTPKNYLKFGEIHVLQRTKIKDQIDK